MSLQQAQNEYWYDLADDDVICDDSCQHGQNGRSRYVGQPIWNFLAGLEVRSFYNAIFFSVRRRGVLFAMPCRGDLPGLRRDMTLRVRRRSATTLRLSFRLVGQSPYKNSGCVPAYSAEAPEYLCACCNNVVSGASRLDPANHDGDRLRFGEHAICPACKSEARAALTTPYIVQREAG
jgi:hypothetical protein